MRQLLEAPIARLTAPQRRSLFREAGQAAESALGIAHSDHPSSAFEQIEAVYRLIVRLAAIKPLLLAVDDIQWCDRPSLDFMCFLGHRANRLPVTIIAAWRRGEPGVRAGRLQALAGKPETLFLTLAPLSHDGVRALIERETRSEPDDEAVEVIHARTGGQPLLVGELVAALRLRNIAPKAGRRAAIEAVTPESVRRDLVARLGRHPETVRRFAEAVAVLETGSVAQTAALVEIDQDRARAAAAALVRAGILDDDSIIAYAYPLLQAAVYDTLPSLERAELHRRAAAMLCADRDRGGPVDPERIADHILASEPAGDPRLAQLLGEVAGHAADRGEFRDAQRYLERALGELTDSSARCELLIQLAELGLRGGDPAAANLHALEGLALAAMPSERVLAAIVCAESEFALRGCPAAVALLDAELDRIPEDDRAWSSMSRPRQRRSGAASTSRHRTCRRRWRGWRPWRELPPPNGRCSRPAHLSSAWRARVAPPRSGTSACAR